MLDRIPEPSFPVYGLAACDRSLRWMDVWNRLYSPDGPLWMVMLGHGDPDSGERIGVVTVAKLAEHPTAHGSIGATGIDDARRWAWLEMVAMATPAAERDSQSFRQALEAAGEGPRDFDTSTLTIEVDGMQTPFLFTNYRRAWAVHADLELSAVGVFGAGVAPQDVALQTVNAQLADYHERRRT